jgi:hypothetical protein
MQCQSRIDKPWLIRGVTRNDGLRGVTRNTWYIENQKSILQLIIPRVYLSYQNTLVDWCGNYPAWVKGDYYKL